MPKIARDQKVTFSTDLGGASGKQMPDNTILLDPYNARAVGDVTRATQGMTPDELQKHNQDIGHWVPSDPQYSLMDTTVAHETGHVVAGKVKPSAMASMNLWGPWAEALGVPPPKVAYVLEGNPRVFSLRTWLAGNGDAIAKAVSEYGTTSVAEMEAEMWSEYTMNANPRPPAKVFGDYVISQLKAQGDL